MKKKLNILLGISLICCVLEFGFLTKDFIYYFKMFINYSSSFGFDGTFTEILVKTLTLELLSLIVLITVVTSIILINRASMRELTTSLKKQQKIKQEQKRQAKLDKALKAVEKLQNTRKN